MFFRVSKILGPQKSQSENELQGPLYSFLAHPEHRIESMATTNDFLITGSTGEICGWDWKTITSSKVSKAKSSWTIPIMQESKWDFFFYFTPNCHLKIYLSKFYFNSWFNLFIYFWLWLTVCLFVCFSVTVSTDQTPQIWFIQNQITLSLQLVETI